MYYVGGHYKCIYNATDLIHFIKHIKRSGGNAIQIFVGDNISTTLTSKAKLDVGDVKKIKKELGSMKLFIHASLSINFANPLIGRYQWALDNLIYDMNFGHQLGAVGCVVHLGTKFPDRYLTNDVDKEANSNMVKSIEYVIDKTRGPTKVIIETTAGQKNKVGNTLEELGKLYKKFKERYKKRVGFCIDTCHIFSAGYPIHTVEGVKDYFMKFNKLIGINKLVLIHLNDSEREFDSKKDRHTALTKGYIYKNNKDPLIFLIKLTRKYKIPVILETRNITGYKSEIAMIKSF